MMGGRAKLLLALVVIAAGVVVAGFLGVFGGGEPPPKLVLPQPKPEGSYELASSLEQLEGTPGAQFTAVVSIVDPQLGRKPVRLRGKGIFNCEGDVQMSVNYLPVLERSAPGVKLADLGLVKKDLVGEVLAVDNDLYVRLPALQKLYASAKPWIHASHDEENASAMELLTRDDPDCDDFLPYLEYGLPEPGSDDTAITDLGDETIRGEQTTHYVLSMSPAEVAAAFSVTLEDLDRALRLLGGDAFDIDFWIDDKGLIRRVSYQDVWRCAKGEPPTEGRFTLDFYDYGIEFDAKPPAKAKVMEEPAFNRLVAQAA
jgi:hypothetical protein